MKHLKYSKGLKRSYEEPFAYMCFSQNALLIAQAGLKLSILWPQPPGFWDYSAITSASIKF